MISLPYTLSQPTIPTHRRCLQQKLAARSLASSMYSSPRMEGQADLPSLSLPNRHQLHQSTTNHHVLFEKFRMVNVQSPLQKKPHIQTWAQGLLHMLCTLCNRGSPQCGQGHPHPVAQPPAQSQPAAQLVRLTIPRIIWGKRRK